MSHYTHQEWASQYQTWAREEDILGLAATKNTYIERDKLQGQCFLGTKNSFLLLEITKVRRRICSNMSEI